MTLKDLIKGLDGEEFQIYESTLALGLLMEKETTHQLSSTRDGELQKILGEEAASLNLSQNDIKIVTGKLVQYVQQSKNPEPMAIWALTKSHDSSIVETLVDLLETVVIIPEKEHLAYQALLGIVNIGIHSEYHEVSLAALHRAADCGYGQVKETAQHYLEKFPGL